MSCVPFPLTCSQNPDSTLICWCTKAKTSTPHQHHSVNGSNFFFPGRLRDVTVDWSALMSKNIEEVGHSYTTHTFPASFRLFFPPHTLPVWYPFLSAQWPFAHNPSSPSPLLSPVTRPLLVIVGKISMCILSLLYAYSKVDITQLNNIF